MRSSVTLISEIYLVSNHIDWLSFAKQRYSNILT